MPGRKTDIESDNQRNRCGIPSWLEEERRCCAATRNVRLAALHSFFKYLQYQNPENLMEWQRILSIPVKKTEKPTINYLPVEEYPAHIGMSRPVNQKRAEGSGTAVAHV